MLHDKADRITCFAATKTFIEFFGRGNRERGRFFIMKRTESEVIGASFFQLDKPADNVNDIKPAEDLLYGSLGDHCSLFRDCEYRLSALIQEAKNQPGMDSILLKMALVEAVGFLLKLTNP
jgi:hypothetical protein